jgi:hypothetical protein
MKKSPLVAVQVAACHFPFLRKSGNPLDIARSRAAEPKPNRDHLQNIEFYATL